MKEERTCTTLALLSLRLPSSLSSLSRRALLMNSSLVPAELEDDETPPKLMVGRDIWEPLNNCCIVDDAVDRMQVETEKEVDDA